MDLMALLQSEQFADQFAQWFLAAMGFFVGYHMFSAKKKREAEQKLNK